MWKFTQKENATPNYLLNETKSIFIYFFVGVIVVAFMMDQQELSLLVANFILLIQALQELFVMPQSSSQLLFFMFESLYK
jgi:hypothetical protein